MSGRKGVFNISVVGAILGLSIVCGNGAQADQTIVVPRTTIYPGDRLTSGLLSVKPLPNRAPGLKSVFAEPEELSGMIARRTLLAGRPIPRDAVRPEPIIRQGEPVSVSYQTSGIEIQLSATAMQSGGIGQTISVRNRDTGRVIKARIQPDKTLIVATP